MTTYTCPPWSGRMLDHILRGRFRVGLDVGIVQIDYSQARPYGAAYRYARELMAVDDYDGDCWKVSSGGQVFIELGFETMANHAMEYIVGNRLPSTDAHQVMRWIRGLPWQGDVVMLHLGW